MASALEQLTSGSTYENPVSYYDFYNAYGRDQFGDSWNDADPNSLPVKFVNFFNGRETTARQLYDQYLARLETEHNEVREDTSYQRSVNDIYKAGYNPYMALGNVSLAPSSAVQSQRQKEEKKETSLLSSALKILALLILKSK